MGEVSYKRVEMILEAAKFSAPTRQGENRIEEIQYYSGYVEPGYTDPESGIVATCNWNAITTYNEETRKWDTVDNTIIRVAKIFEKLGIELEWSDEWRACDDCMKIFRISPDGHGWQPSYVTTEDGYQYCIDCIDAEEHLSNLEGNERAWNRIEQIDPEEHDYLLIQEGFEHGMCRGMDADPPRIAKLLREIGVRRFIFNQDEQSQFYIGFSVWMHEDEKHLLEAAKHALETGETDGPSIAAAMERGLMEASRQADELRAKGEVGDGLVYSSISPDRAETRVISQEDLLEKGTKP